MCPCAISNSQYRMSAAGGIEIVITSELEVSHIPAQTDRQANDIQLFPDGAAAEGCSREVSTLL